MTENEQEYFEVKNKDPELHSIDLMLEVLNRHLDRSNDGPCNSEDNIDKGRSAMIRVARYVLERVEYGN